jgi:hypothetical protein
VRLPSLTDDKWNERVRAALAVMLPTGRHDPRNGRAMASLVRHPDLAGPFLASNARLLMRSALPPGRRELAILRAARRRGVRAEGRQPTAFGVVPERKG